LTHQSTAYFTKCKLKLHTGTNSCRLSAVRVGLVSQVWVWLT